MSHICQHISIITLLKLKEYEGYNYIDTYKEVVKKELSVKKVLKVRKDLEVSFFIRTFALSNIRAQVGCIKRLYNYGKKD